MGKLFKIGPVVMEIEALKVGENRDFPKISHPGGAYIVDFIDILSTAEKS